jgi:hypothetical protein
VKARLRLIPEFLGVMAFGFALYGVMLFLEGRIQSNSALFSFETWIGRAPDSLLYRFLWLFGDVSEAEFYASLFGGIGILAFAFLAYLPPYHRNRLGDFGPCFQHNAVRLGGVRPRTDHVHDRDLISGRSLRGFAVLYGGIFPRPYARHGGGFRPRYGANRSGSRIRCAELADYCRVEHSDRIVNSLGGRHGIVRVLHVRGAGGIAIATDRSGGSLVALIVITPPAIAKVTERLAGAVRYLLIPQGRMLSKAQVFLSLCSSAPEATPLR